jgi:hypothetical protein
MTFDANDVLRVISKWDAARLEKLGATVGKDSVTATEEQLRSVPAIRHELLKAGLLTIGTGGGGGGFALLLNAVGIQLSGQDLTLGD